MKALVLVDLQNDFCPGGALAVTKGDEVVPVANRLITGGFADVNVCTQDWHPPTHKSFRSNNDVPEDEIVGMLNGVPQVWWPDHCVWGTEGGQYHKNLMSGRVSAFFRKGMNSKVDSYSGFFDNKTIFDGKEVRSPTGMGGYLKALGVTDVYVMGLATDYCVKFTALDAVELGFNTHLVLDGCRGVNLSPEDSDKAVNEMKEAGVKIVNSDKLLGIKGK